MKSMFTALTLAAFLIAAAPVVKAESAAPKGEAAAATAAPKVFTSPQKEGTKATCPVTGESFTIAKKTAHAEYKGKHVYFCCPSCQKSFDKDPEKYTK
jgi:YHS domain-containing protein